MALPLPPSVDAVRIRVPAKINLALVVGAPGADGYHPLATVFQAVSLYDDVTASWAEAGTVSLTLSGEGAAELPTDERNLAVRAALLLRDRYGEPGLGVRLEIRKGIPVAGGMAGGSADAAGALLACSMLWDLDTTPDDLHDLAAELGSDVPFALAGGVALGTGRGDRLCPCLTRGCYHWVVALSPEGLSTPAVYRRYDELGLAAERLEAPAGMMAALAAGDARALAPLLRNDLQHPALDLRPDLRRTLEVGTAAGALAGIVSGSGPTVAFLAANESAALDLCHALSAAGVGRVRHVSGPVPGARLVS